MKSNSLLWIIFFPFLALMAETMHYAVHDIHTLPLEKNRLEIALAKLQMNDTLDILKLKESEFGNTASFASIGDLDGYTLTLRYGINDSLTLIANRTLQDISYSSETLTNTKDEIMLRYHLFDDALAVFNSGITFDIGYTKNYLKDFYFKNISEINNLISKPSILGKLKNKYPQITSAKFEYYENHPILNDGYYFLINNMPQSLKSAPFISLSETEDDSYYVRLLTGIHFDKTIYDMYFGYKKTSIDTLVSLNAEGTLTSFSMQEDFSREESMFFLGFTISKQFEDILFEFGYEYEKIFRESALNDIDYNHILQIHMSYLLDKNILLYAGGKIMYRQFNGQIPYLYNSFTQTTFDHMYGYATFGLQYNF